MGASRWQWVLILLIAGGAILSLLYLQGAAAGARSPAEEGKRFGEALAQITFVLFFIVATVVIVALKFPHHDDGDGEDEGRRE